MKKYFIALIVIGLIFPACVNKKKTTALERLKASYGRDAIEKMKFPQRDSAVQPGKAKPALESGRPGGGAEKQGETFAPIVDVQQGIDEDLKSLKKLRAPTTKTVVVTGGAVNLRKGAGTQFKKIGTAFKGDTFDLLRITRDPQEDHAWYQIQDKKSNKYFISSLFSIISPVVKESIKRRQESTLQRLQTIIDPEPPLPPELIEAKHITLNFEETDIHDVITTFSELLKIDYIIESPVSGKVTLQTFNKIPVEDLYSVLEQILALHNLTVVKSGNFYRFLPISSAVKKPLSVYYGGDAKVPSNERLVIQIIPLKHISVESMKQIISPLLTNNASFIEIPETNNLMMIELASNVGRILNVVAALDIDKLASSDIQLYTIKHTDVSLLADELTEIFSTLGFEDAMGDSLNFLPLSRLNSLLVVNAFKSILPTIEFWINKLDQPIVQAQLSTFVYHVQYGEADRLATILNALFKGQQKSPRKAARAKAALRKQPTTAKTSAKSLAKGAKSDAPALTRKRRSSLKVTGGITGEMEERELTIIADKDTNSLIIRTKARFYPAILEVLKKLDLMPKQVMIEVLILDLTLDAQTQSGLEWALEGRVENARFSTGSGTGSNLGAGIGSATSIFASPGFSFFLGNANKLKALLQAFAADSKANLLSNPILITSNNKAASISITDEIPIQSTTITTPTAGQPLTQSTIEFRSVGIKLNILPIINSENFVTLKIQQEISKPGPVIGTTTSFNIRSITTEVVVKDNQVLVMGGLMQTNTSESSTGIPFLKDLPFFGKLFGSTTTTANKTELMIFITPHVITNETDVATVTSQIKNRLLNLKAEFGLSDG